MLKIPEGFENAVNDYKLNLVQVRESERLQFGTQDVNTVFEVRRKIFKKDYEGLERRYRHQEIDSELGLVIGAITESKELMRHALRQKRGQMNVCTALEELKMEGIKEGAISGIIKTYQEFDRPSSDAALKIQMEYGLGQQEAREYVRRYWRKK